MSQHFDKVHAIMSRQQLYALTDMLLCGNICEEAVLCPTKPLQKTASMKTTIVGEETKHDEHRRPQQSPFNAPSSTYEAPSSPYEPPPEGPSPEGTPKNRTRSFRNTSSQKMTPRKLLAEWLRGTRWAMFDSENVLLGWIELVYSNHGEFEKSDGSKRNIKWSALSMRKIQIMDSQVRHCTSTRHTKLLRLKRKSWNARAYAAVEKISISRSRRCECTDHSESVEGRTLRHGDNTRTCRVTTADSDSLPLLVRIVRKRRRRKRRKIRNEMISKGIEYTIIGCVCGISYESGGATQQCRWNSMVDCKCLDRKFGIGCDEWVQRYEIERW